MNMKIICMCDNRQADMLFELVVIDEKNMLCHNEYEPGIVVQRAVR